MRDKFNASVVVVPTHLLVHQIGMSARRTECLAPVTNGARAFGNKCQNADALASCSAVGFYLFEYEYGFTRDAE
jgi:hypothetical protein